MLQASCSLVEARVLPALVQLARCQAEYSCQHSSHLQHAAVDPPCSEAGLGACKQLKHQADQKGHGPITCLPRQKQLWHGYRTAGQQRACNESSPTWKSESREAWTLAGRGQQSSRLKILHTPAVILTSVERDCQCRLSPVALVRRFGYFLRAA